MRQIAIFVAVLFAIALAAAIWFGPALVDWDRYRGPIADRIAARTGLDATIAGPVRLTLLPRPRAWLSDVTLANGADGPRLDVAAMEVGLDPVALVTGRLAPVDLRLTEPSLALAAERGSSADLIPMIGALPDARVAVEDGTVRRGARLAVSELTATIVAAGAAGSRRASLSALADGVPVTVEVRLGGARAKTRPFRVDVALPAASATLSYEGRVDFSGEPGARGRLIAGGPDLGVLTSLVARATGVEAADIPLVPSAFSVAGALAVDGDGLSLDDIEARIGNSQATGALSAAWDAAPRADLALAFGRVALDGPPAAEAAGLLRLLGRSGLIGSLDLTVEAARVGERVLRAAGLSLARQQRGAPWRVSRLGAELPGGGAVSLTGAASLPPSGGASFDGALTARADNLRLLLAWLDLQPSEVAADRLRRLELTADLSLEPERLEAKRIDATLDGSRVGGELSLSWADGRRLAGVLSADRMNLDAYLPATARAVGGDAVRFPLAGVEGGVDLSIARAVWRERAVDDLKLAVTIGDGAAVARPVGETAPGG